MCKSGGFCTFFWLCIAALGTMIVGALDVMIGLITLVLSFVSFSHFTDLLVHLRSQQLPIGVAWFGIISIPVVAVVGFFSGCALLRNLASTKIESHHYWKFWVFFIAEVIGFAAPFLIFQEYSSQLDRIRSFHTNFYIFYLLDINQWTMTLFGYQIVSFCIVTIYYWLKEKAYSVSPETRTRQHPKPKPTLGRKTNSMQQCGDPSCSEILIQKRPSRPTVTKSVEGHSSTLAKKEPTAFQQELRIKLYPDLQQVNFSTATLTTRTSPINKKDCVISICDSEDEQGDDPQWKDFDDEDGLETVRETPLKKPRAKSNSAFNKIKRECLKNQKLFVDEDFPASQRSLGSGRKLEWKRPYDIHEDARFFTDGASRFDVRQGELGDCWFLAAVANLTLNDGLFKKVLPFDNEWADNGDYCGVCHFRFWVDGRWEEVIIDDRLPTRKGKLVYLHSSDNSEFWSALLEKAYAKLNGSYASLDGNDGIGRAMMNMTGGKVTRHLLQDFENQYAELFLLMEKALANGRMLGCCTCKDSSNEGIFGGHAYSITHVKKIEMQNLKSIMAIRIRNPWGNEQEWTGKFSDGHRIWELVDKKVKKELQLIFQNDGEFWFPVKELARYFDMVEICHL